MRDFIGTIIRAIAQGFGFTLGRDVANGVVHQVEDRFGGSGGGED